MMLRLSWAQLRYRPARYVAITLGITISVAFIIAILGAVTATSATVNTVFSQRYDSTDVLIEGLGQRQDGTIAESNQHATLQEQRLRELLASSDQVTVYSLDFSTPISVTLPNNTTVGTTLRALAEDASMQWQTLSSGRLPTNRGEVMAGAGRNLKVGDSINVRGSTGVSEELKIVGLFSTENDPDEVGTLPLFAGSEQVRAVTKIVPTASARVQGIRDVGPLEAQQQRALAASITALLQTEPLLNGVTLSTGVEKSSELADKFLKNSRLFSTVLYAFAVIACAVAALIIATTFAVVIAARQRENALLRCVGASPAHIVGMVMFEALIIGGVATALGCVLGPAALSFFASRATSFGVRIPVTELEIPAYIFAIAIGVGMGIALLSAALPLIAASRISPLSALRPVDTAPARLWISALISGLGLLGLGASWGPLQAAVSDRSIQQAGVWAVVFFTAALITVVGCLPVIALTVLTPLSALAGPIGLVGGRNISRSPRRTAAIASAVMVGTTLVSAMVLGSELIRPAVQARFVDQVAFDLQITEKDSILPAGLTQRVRQEPAVAASYEALIMPIKTEDGKASAVRVIDPAAFDAIPRFEVTLPQPGDIIFPPSTRIVPRSAEGKQLTFTFFNDQKRTLTVRFHNDLRRILVNSQDAPQWPQRPEYPGGGPWPEDVEIPREFIPRAELWVRLVDFDSDNTETTLQGLRGTVAEFGNKVAFVELFRARHRLENTADQVFTLTRLLISVAVALAALGVINTMLLSITERQRERSLLLGVGVTRAGIMGMILWETTLIASIAAGAGALIGTLLGVLGSKAVLGYQPEHIQALALPIAGYSAAAGVAIALAAGTVTAIASARGKAVAAREN